MKIFAVLFNERGAQDPLSFKGKGVFNTVLKDCSQQLGKFLGGRARKFGYCQGKVRTRELYLNSKKGKYEVRAID